MITLQSETFGEIVIVVDPEASGTDECRRRKEIQDGDTN
jgi:hypothetical protein